MLDLRCVATLVGMRVAVVPVYIFIDTSLALLPFKFRRMSVLLQELSWKNVKETV